jgi:hypothetical protein
MEYYQFDIELKNYKDNANKSIKIAHLPTLEDVFDLNKKMNTLTNTGIRNIIRDLSPELLGEGYKFWGYGWRRCHESPRKPLNFYLAEAVTHALQPPSFDPTIPLDE